MNKIELTTIEFLHKMEIPPHLKGYEYVKTAVQEIYKKPNIIFALTKELYPTIAEKHNTEGSRVERGIRHAVVEQSNHDAIKSVLHINSESLTNSSFLAALTEAVRIQLVMEGAVEL